MSNQTRKKLADTPPLASIPYWLMVWPFAFSWHSLQVQLGIGGIWSFIVLLAYGCTAGAIDQAWRKYVDLKRAEKARDADEGPSGGADS